MEDANVGVDPAGSERSNWILEYVDVENFKSYKGKVRIGPLRRFIAIIGPNGSGKSNLMDALSFVMGERTACLRVRRMNELIHGASIGKPVASHASVSATFTNHGDDGGTSSGENELVFTRAIRGTTCDYIVNGQVVGQQKYIERLGKLGINVKAKNFLVFQGAVESIAMRSPKERTTLIEEICGSIALKEEFEQMKSEMENLEEKIQVSYMKKKGIAADRKDAKLDLDEATRFKQLQEEIEKKEIEIQLFKLLYTEEAIQDVENEYAITGRRVEKLEGKRRTTEEGKNSKKKEHGELTRQLNSKETMLRTVEQEKTKKQPKLIEHQQKLQHFKKKLESASRSLQQATQNKNAQAKDLAQLQKTLELHQEKERELVEQYEESQMTQGCNINLRESQMQEYWELKTKVTKATREEKQQLDKLEQQHKETNEVYASLNRQMAELDAKVNLICQEVKEKAKLSEKSHGTVEALKEQLHAKQEEVEPLQTEISSAEEQIPELKRNLEKLSNELDNAKMEKHEYIHHKRKQEVIDSLKSVFPGVFDRVMNLCKPRHDRYRVAVTKVLGKNMEAIVVDNEKTARQCIHYLKEQMLGREVFLPLDLLEVKPLQIRFREQQQRNIHLTYDILQFKHDVEKAIRHCTKSTVICQTSEDASRVASGEMLGEAVNAVSLEGTYYATNGIISGGQADLQRKARLWDDSVLAEKEKQKEEVRQKLKEAIIVSRKKHDLDFFLQEVDGIQKRMKYAQVELNSTIKEVQSLEAKKKSLEDERSNVEDRWKQSDAAKLKFVGQVTKIQKKMDSIEDKIFSQFCRQVGISNIRSYEERDIRAHEEFNRERLDLQSKIQEVEANIEYENNEQESLENNITKWKDSVRAIQESLNNFVQEKDTVLSEMNKIEMKLTKLNEEVEDLRKLCDAKMKETSKITQELNSIDKALLSEQKAKAHRENILVEKKIQRHEIFKHCKLSGINIPFVVGSLEDIRLNYSSSPLGSIESDQTSKDVTQSGSGSTGFQRAIDAEENLRVNYDGLESNLKGLSKSDAKTASDELEQQLQDLESNAAQIHAPNTKADEWWKALNTKAREQQNEFEEIRKQAKQARMKFEKVKKERNTKFMNCYEKISENIDGVYKALTRDQSAQAILGLDNPEEPYLDGVSYNCVAPGKRFNAMSNLSGGEKTLAALALLIAIHSYEPAPFFVLDEIDGALDNTNIGKVTSYIKEKAKDLQVIVISLKEELYGQADAIIGVTPSTQESECAISKIFTLDLSRYTSEAA